MLGQNLGRRTLFGAHFIDFGSLFAQLAALRGCGLTEHQKSRWSLPAVRLNA